MSDKLRDRRNEQITLSKEHSNNVLDNLLDQVGPINPMTCKKHLYLSFVTEYWMNWEQSEKKQSNAFLFRSQKLKMYPNSKNIRFEKIL